MSQPAMINRYRWYELVGIYAGIFVFLAFILAPFVEGFLVSLKPLSRLFSSPYRFWPENGSFEAYRTMWVSVPGFARYIFNSFFISVIVTAVVLALVVPAAYAFARFRFRGSGALLAAFLAVNMNVFGHPAYSAAKAGLLHLTRLIAVEYGKFGIRANAVAPATVRTQAWEARAAANPQVFEEAKRWYPLQRIVDPKDVAEAVHFLASPAAGAISGICLPVDCGLTAGQADVARTFSQSIHY